MLSCCSFNPLVLQSVGILICLNYFVGLRVIILMILTTITLTKANNCVLILNLRYLRQNLNTNKFIFKYEYLKTNRIYN